MADEKNCFIFKLEKDMTIDGHVLAEKQLTVQGNTLKECEEIFDRKWKEKIKKK